MTLGTTSIEARGSQPANLRRPVVKVDGLHKHFRRNDGTKVPAIDDVSFELYAGEIIRKPHVRFLITLREIDVPQTADRDADILAATASLQAAFEASIRRHPEQWMWSHRRWG